MKLRELLHGCDYIDSSLVTCHLSLDTDISGVAYDSRKVKEGYLFVAIKGEKHDGHDFIGDAIKRGAVAIVHEKTVTSYELRVTSKEKDLSLVTRHLSLIQVKNSRKALACIANNFYGRPSERLTVIGITGTNGKTTTTYLLKSILESWGKEIGLIGTIQYMIKDKSYSALYTTPEALEFHGLLRDMLLSGCTHIISEVSSHALAQSRVDGTVFKTVAFTNLTREHLDFHKTLEDYFRAKERLFRELLDKDGTSVINLDDLYGKRLISSLSSGVPRKSQDFLGRILTYGLETGADIMARDINSSFKGLRFKIAFRGRNYNISSALMGLPNVYNIMSAAGASISIGVPWDIILEGIKNLGTVTGRFEKVNLDQNFLCIVDYAHTEDALERLIYTARELINKPLVNSHQSLVKDSNKLRVTSNKYEDKNLSLVTCHSSPRIITVFGCGGDRDRSKRPGMGTVATRLSDFVIITSDNPRSEDPNKIIREIEAGAIRRNYIIEPDRAEAIKRAIMLAGEGDIVLVAGKGHEDYQEIKGVRYRFNDREILEKAIKQRIKS
ncbi:MAG: UDP-N-acetylmuramoyl-L-alanyl-D-glutamate--2,6-diaminopimelate ligase [Nitrospirota bacterium]